MSFIKTPIDLVDKEVKVFAENFFNTIGGPIEPVIQGMGILSLALITLNYFVQFRPLPFAILIPWTIKYICVFLVVTSWANFEPIYDFLHDTPSNLVGGILDAAGKGQTEGSIYSKLDGIVGGMFSAGVFFIFATTMFSIGLSVPALVIISIAVGVAGTVVAIVVGAKISFGIGIALAPLFVPMLFFEQTKHYFTGWLKFTLGAAFTNVFFAAMMGIVMLAIGSGFSSGIKGALGALILIFSCAGLVQQLPNIVNGLMGAAAAVGGSLPGSSVSQAHNKDKETAATRRAYRELSAANKESIEASGGSYGTMNRVSDLIAAHRVSSMSTESMSDRQILGSRHDIAFGGATGNPNEVASQRQRFEGDLESDSANALTPAQRQAYENGVNDMLRNPNDARWNGMHENLKTEADRIDFARQQIADSTEDRWAYLEDETAEQPSSFSAADNQGQQKIQRQRQEEIEQRPKTKKTRRRMD